MAKKESRINEKHNGNDDANDDDARLRVGWSLFCDANVLIEINNKFKRPPYGWSFLVGMVGIRINTE